MPIYSPIPKMRNILSDKIFRASSLLFICMMFGNVFNFLYQAFMSRALSVEEFGTLNSLLSLFVIVSLPVQTLHTTLAGVTSHLKARQAYHNISRLFYNMLLKISMVGICGITIFVLFSGYLRDYLKIPSIYPLLIVGVLMMFGFLLSVNFGILQGLQSFNSFGIISSLNSLFRLVFGALLVYLGFGVEGALGGLGLGTLIVFFSSAIILRTSLFKLKSQNPVDEPGTHTLEWFSYSVPVLIALLCFTILTNIDLVLVKHFFSAEEAGSYAVATILGKAILFLPGAIVLAMFPMVSESHALKTDSYRLLKKSLVFAGVLLCIGIQMYIFSPKVLVTLLMGAKHASTAHLVRLYGLAMLPFVFINIFMYFNLATHRMRFLYTFVAGSLVEIVLIYTFHSSLQQVVYTLASIGGVLLTVNILLVLVEMRRNNIAERPLFPTDTKGK